MCGLVGVVSPNGKAALEEQHLVAMRDTMIARGPDGAGVFVESNIALGHRRLAIRDLEHGQQPMVSQNERFVVVYNGEIYNDDEIAKELSQHNVRLKTRCDTEVLVEAWSLWGPGCLSRLRGMFSFGVVDRFTGKAWIVRDRLGIKPLFYAMVGDHFVFASSIAAIRRHPKFSSQPNFAAINHYLMTLRLTLGSQTVFQGVSTVQPGEMIELEDGKLNTSRYWRLPYEEVSGVCFESSVDVLGATLDEAVQLRLKSDVEVGMMMSGGVDSNTLANLVRQQVNRPVVGICGGGQPPEEEQPGSDYQFARDCADILGFDYSETRVKPESYLETWQYLVSSHETPLATPTDAIIFHIAQRLKESVGVALGGEGADEAFCGYAIPHWSGNDYVSSQRLCSTSKSEQIRQSLIGQYGRDQFASISDHYLLSNGLIPWSAQRALFKPDYLPRGGEQFIHSHYQRLFDEQGDVSTPQKYARVLLRVNLESLLSRLDTSTMAASLESRVPYADHVLVEQAFRMPHHFKIDVCPSEEKPWLGSWELAKRGSLRTKRVLRAFASKMMPKRLALRPKMSFPTPLQSWLNQDWTSWIDNKLQTSPFAKEVFQGSALSEINRIPPNMSLWKWPILNTIIWGDHCFGN